MINEVVTLDRTLSRYDLTKPDHSEISLCPLSPDEALIQLEKGNKNFVSTPRPCLEIGKFDPDKDPPPQCPIAVLVCCSDSRVPPELVFWQGLGRLFIVRVAGNTVDAAALGSIAYAVSTFGTPLVVVLGHEHCGAVKAAVDFVEDDKPYDGILAGVVEPILPAVIAAKKIREEVQEENVQAGGETADMAAKLREVLVEAASRQNVRRTVDALRTSLSPIPKDQNGKELLRIVGARYDVNVGIVDFFYKPQSTEVPSVVA